jgi:uncharacterized protein YjiS (DUF1127 family)
MMKPTHDVLYENLSTRYAFLSDVTTHSTPKPWNVRLVQKLKMYKQVYRTRQQLSRLRVEQLNDIGITRAQALKEANKPFWKS